MTCRAGACPGLWSLDISNQAATASVLSRVIVDNDPLGRNPLTRPAPAEENAGGGPPSPPRGRGAGSEGLLSTIKWDRTLVPSPSPQSRRVECYLATVDTQLKFER
jgi:hypothetical protein